MHKNPSFCAISIEYSVFHGNIRIPVEYSPYMIRGALGGSSGIRVGAHAHASMRCSCAALHKHMGVWPCAHAADARAARLGLWEASAEQHDGTYNQHQHESAARLRTPPEPSAGSVVVMAGLDPRRTLAENSIPAYLAE